MALPPAWAYTWTCTPGLRPRADPVAATQLVRSNGQPAADDLIVDIDTEEFGHRTGDANQNRVVGIPTRGNWSDTCSFAAAFTWSLTRRD
jgi:hypothetical protein